MEWLALNRCSQPQRPGRGRRSVGLATPAPSRSWQNDRDESCFASASRILRPFNVNNGEVAEFEHAPANRPLTAREEKFHRLHGVRAASAVCPRLTDRAWIAVEVRKVVDSKRKAGRSRVVVSVIEGVSAQIAGQVPRCRCRDTFDNET